MNSKNEETLAKTSSGFGRLLIVLYAILALAASARAIYQLLSGETESYAASWMSLASGLIYLVATISLAKASRRARVFAWISITLEAVGVIVVGVLSLTHVSWLNEASVWSYFGRDYGYIPLVLPFIGLYWLRVTKRRRK